MENTEQTKDIRSQSNLSLLLWGSSPETSRELLYAKIPAPLLLLAVLLNGVSIAHRQYQPLAWAMVYAAFFLQKPVVKVPPGNPLAESMRRFMNSGFITACRWIIVACCIAYGAACVVGWIPLT